MSGADGENQGATARRSQRIDLTCHTRTVPSSEPLTSQVTVGSEHHAGDGGAVAGELLNGHDCREIPDVHLGSVVGRRLSV